MQKTRRITALTALATSAALLFSGCAPLQALQQAWNTLKNADTADRALENVSGLGSYTEQHIAWRSCEGGLECAEIAAPLDWDSPTPGSNDIVLAVARKKSTSTTPKGTIFVNPGGPGASGIAFLQQIGESWEPLLKNYNIAAWDPRGVGSSAAIDCFTDAQLDERLFTPSEGAEEGTEKWLEETADDNIKAAAGCEKLSGDLYKHVGTNSSAQDLDLLRELVGDTKLNYLGFSYGTFLGARYAEMFPQNAGRLVLDGALDPAADANGVVAFQTKGFERALRNYLTDCLTRTDCWFKGSVADGEKIIADQLAQLDKNPLQAGSDERTVDVNIFYTAIATPLYSKANWPLLDDLFTEIADGKTDTALLLADFYYSREDGKYTDNQTEAFQAINCIDYPQAKPDLAKMKADAAALANEAPLFGKYQGYSDAACWGWPVAGADNAKGEVHAADAEPILVIGTTGDPATPYEWAVSLAKQLESGILLTFEGEGHTAFGDNDCVNQTVYDFFAGHDPKDGKVCTA